MDQADGTLAAIKDGCNVATVSADPYEVNVAVKKDECDAIVDAPHLGRLR